MKRLCMLSMLLLLAFGLVSCINQSNDNNFSAEPATGQLPANIDAAVSSAILEQETSYLLGETATEGHLMLDSVEKEGIITVYTIASFGAFGFENTIFTKISGSGAIPTVLTFSSNEDGAYSLLEYKEPLDGTDYIDSIKEMFPPGLHSRVLAAENDYAVLAEQQETQAKAYLESIGRAAEVSVDHVEKQLPEIDVQASNKLFTELTKHNIFLNDCPYWLGTREKVEAGVRYIYETSQSKTDDGYDLIIFQKKKEDGTLLEECQYIIIGTEPIKI